MLVILIGLGTWQYQRLQWKTALLAEVEASVTAEPLSGFSDVKDLIDEAKPVDFRRIQLTAEILAFETPFRVFTGENRDISWRLYSPVRNEGITAFAARGIISDITPPPIENSKSKVLAGYVRLARPENRPNVKSTPTKNRWFGFNPIPETDDWSGSVRGEVDTGFYIDVVPGAQDAKLLPAKRPQIRNNHFDYMLTWYGLAIVLLIIYVILHKREGRFSWS